MKLPTSVCLTIKPGWISPELREHMKQCVACEKCLSKQQITLKEYEKLINEVDVTDTTQCAAHVNVVLRGFVAKYETAIIGNNNTPTYESVDKEIRLNITMLVLAHRNWKQTMPDGSLKMGPTEPIPVITTPELKAIAKTYPVPNYRLTSLVAMRNFLVAYLSETYFMATAGQKTLENREKRVKILVRIIQVLNNIRKILREIRAADLATMEQFENRVESNNLCETEPNQQKSRKRAHSPE